MQKRSQAEARRSLLLCLFVLGLVTAVIVLPYQFGTAASQKGLYTRTESADPELPNYDIRTEKGEAIESYLASSRESVAKSLIAVADIRDGFVRGEESLRSRVPQVKFEYNSDIRIPEVITPDVWKSKVEFLSQPTEAKRSDVLRNFVKENNSLVGVDNQQADDLVVTQDYTNPDGYMSFAQLEQRINGIPVFRGEVKAGFTKDGRIIRVINNLAPGLDYSSLSTDFGDPLNAVRAAAGHIKYELKNVDVTPNAAESSDLKTVFGGGDWATTAEKMYFPTEPGVAVPSWRVLIWEPVNAYYVIVDAHTGTMLWRKNITNDQTQSATYQIYRNSNSFIGAADNPAPLSPGPVNPTLGTQGLIATRSTVTLIGNEAPYAFNTNGWVTDGTNITDGNNVEAGIDRDGTNGVDAPVTGNPNRVFDSTWNPPPGNPIPGDDPLTVQAQRGAVIQMFYVMNRYHDELYRLGFNEQSFNFQANNFGRGGAGNDRVSAEGQDSSGTDNANFSTPADGGRGRMQMYLWTGPTPDYDGTGDAEVIIHEVTHGTSNRLHGNASGLSTNMSGGMGEGWGDFFGYSMLSEPADPINGVYTTGGYATYLITAGFTGNYYYGIRRFPRAPITFVGANGKPHNPFTFKYVNNDCNTLIGTTSSGPNSAFPRGPIGVSTCDQVHNIGEIWSSMLWEIRNRMVTRLGWAAGTSRVLQVVTDGMKLAPLGPTILQERDAIIAAAAALPIAPAATADVADVREGFRVRGAGFSASIQNPGTGSNNTAVTEAFDVPNVMAGGAATVTSGNNLLEPNECNTLTVPVTNNSDNAATNITAVLSTSTPGITVTQPNSAYPNLAAGAGPVNNTTPFQVSVDNTVACFTTANFTLTVSFTGAGGGSPITINFSLPVGLPGTNYVFTSSTGATIPAGGTLVSGSTVDDTTVAIPLPSGWNSTVYGIPVTSLTASSNGFATVNGPSATTFTNTALLAAVGGTNPSLFPNWDDFDMDPGDTTNGGIYINTVGSAPNRQFYVEWRATHFDDSTTAINTNVAILLTEGSDTVRYIYVLTGQNANANGASATIGIQKSSAAGSPFTQFSFNSAGSTSPGLMLTGARPAGVCTPGSGTCNAVAVRSRADFDGDGKTDLSIFRPSDGNWWLQQSTAGFGVVHWGVSTDSPTPGDFDGDGKTDFAIFRPDANPANPDFFILNSNGFTVKGVSWGLAGDIPVIADYDGDQKSDVAVYRPSDNTFYILNSGGGATFKQYGIAGDVPVAGDFIGDAKADITLFRPSTNTWWIFNGSGDTVVTFGVAGDVLVPADYNGDNKDDIAVFRPSTGQWIYLPSGGGSAVFANWGVPGDIPVPGDYDGDGKDDFAIYRNGTWWLLRSTSGTATANFGLTTDKPIPRQYLP